MGFRVKRSFSIGKGVKFNVGKTGVSMGFGTKGLRSTIHSSGRRTNSIGIPGTGISYTTVSSGSSTRHSSGGNVNRSQTQTPDGIVERYDRLIEIITSIHKNVDEKIDWEYLSIKPEPFDQNKKGPKQDQAETAMALYKPSLSEKLVKSLKDKKILGLKEAINQAIADDKDDYEAWKNLSSLANRVVTKDMDAYLDVIEEMKPLDDLLEFGSDFDFNCADGDILEVTYHAKTKNIVPDYSVSLTKTGKLSRKDLSKTAHYELLQDYVCSTTIKIARDMFAVLPFEQVIVHVLNDIIDSQTGHETEIVVLSVIFDRLTLERLNFDQIDPSDALNNFPNNMKFLKTSGFKSVDRIKTLD